MICVLDLFYKEKSLLAAKTKSETEDDDEDSRETAERLVWAFRLYFAMPGTVSSGVCFPWITWRKTSEHRNLILSFISPLSGQVFVGKELPSCLLFLICRMGLTVTPPAWGSSEC